MGRLFVRPRRWRGQSVVEFAFVSLMILLLTFGTIDLGRGVYQRQLLANAAREAARYGSIFPGDKQGMVDRAAQTSPSLGLTAANFTSSATYDEIACATWSRPGVNASAGVPAVPSGLMIAGAGNTLAPLAQGTPRTLTLSVAPADGGSISASPAPDRSGGRYSDGVSVTLTATAAAGYVFTGWGGAASGTTNPVVVVMDADKTVVANFARPTPTPTSTPVPPTNTPVPPTPTNTPVPPTNTPIPPTPTNTPVPPTATSTPAPTATNTPGPTPTNTPMPTATNTPAPTATNTPGPTPTNTPAPTATNTPAPTATNTPALTATNTPASTPTNTPVPTSTPTPLPTSTPTATAGPIPTASGACAVVGNRLTVCVQYSFGLTAPRLIRLNSITMRECSRVTLQ